MCKNEYCGFGGCGECSPYLGDSNRLPSVQAVPTEVEVIRQALKEPAYVWAAMLRGDIAMPELVRHADARFCELARRIDNLQAECTRQVGLRRELEEELRKARRAFADHP